METARKRSSGISSNGLRTWGMFFLLAGMLGKSILQNGLLNLGAVSFRAAAGADADLPAQRCCMQRWRCSWQAMETCAVPIFAFLLVEGVEHTSSLRNYALRVAGLAVLSELPYNLATSGKLLDTTSRQPGVRAGGLSGDGLPVPEIPGEECTASAAPGPGNGCSSHLVFHAVHPVWKQHGGPFRRAVGVPGQRLLPEPCGLGSVHPVLHLLAVLHGCARWAFWPFTFTTVKKARKTASSIIWRIRHCCWSSAQQGGFCSEPVPRFQS